MNQFQKQSPEMFLKKDGFKNSAEIYNKTPGFFH